MRDYRRLTVWAKAHELTLRVYQVSAAFPSDERFGLVSQMRRAAASIPANIAEGRGRGTEKDFARFLRIAAGSLNELEYHSLLAKDLGYLTTESAQEITERCIEVRRMLARLLQRLSEPDELTIAPADSGDHSC